MTNQHPLTDEIIRYDKKLGCQDFGTWIYTENDLRAGADWQLDQVIEWLKYNADVYMYEAHDGPCFDEDGLLDDFKKAMRPTQEINS